MPYYSRDVLIRNLSLLASELETDPLSSDLERESAVYAKRMADEIRKRPNLVHPIDIFSFCAHHTFDGRGMLVQHTSPQPHYFYKHYLSEGNGRIHLELPQPTLNGASADQSGRIKKGIETLKNLIDDYNKIDLIDKKNKSEKLKEIFIALRQMESGLSADWMKLNEEYFEDIHESLFDELQAQCLVYHLGTIEALSSQKSSLADAPYREKQPQPSALQTCLQALNKLNTSELAKVVKALSVAPEEDDDEDMTASLPASLRQHYTLVFLGGGNSLNYKMTHRQSGDSFVLKVESMTPALKHAETLKGNAAITGVFVPVFQSHSVALGSPGVKDDKLLSVTEYCDLGNVTDYFRKLKGDSNRVNAAVTVFSHMAETLLSFQQAGVAFPDAKNTNWLLSENGKLTPRVADTKSLIKTTPSGAIDRRAGHCVYSVDYAAPELNDDSRQYVDAESMHVYMIGMNLCWALSGSPDFYPELLNTPVFKSSEQAKLLGQLMASMLHPDPKRRPPLSLVLQKLNQLKLDQEVSTLLTKRDGTPTSESSTSHGPTPTTSSVTSRGSPPDQVLKSKLVLERMHRDSTPLLRTTTPARKITPSENRLSTATTRRTVTPARSSTPVAGNSTARYRQKMVEQSDAAPNKKPDLTGGRLGRPLR